MNTLTDAFWDKYFEVYDVLNELLPYQYLLAALVSALDIKQGEAILDAGAGTGNMSVLIAHAGGVPTGLDISNAGRKIFKRKLPNNDYVVSDLSKKIPFADHSFDKIVSNNVLYAIAPDARPQLGTELFRVLRPGGRIVIANIAPGFRPFEIYTAHLQEEVRRSGMTHTLYKILSFLKPTAQMFYYNWLIQRQHTGGAYAFMSENDQESFLKNAGFERISESKRHYGGHGVLTYAHKSL